MFNLYIKRETKTLELKHKYFFKVRISWKSTNLIYEIKWLRCNEINCVGETGTTMYMRTQHNPSTVNWNQDNTRAHNFNLNDRNFSVIGIDQIKR